MRTATYDRKSVRVRNASHLGYSKGTARRGDWVAWARPGDGGQYLGRVVGRVAYAAAEGPDIPAITGWLAVLTLGGEGTWASLHWVDPAWVSQCHAHTPDIGRFWSWFASDTVPGPDEASYLHEYGSYRANQAPEHGSWDLEHAIARGRAARKRATSGRRP